MRAHLQHVQMYAGERVENPVADRTRKVQDWNVLTKWHKEFKRPITFADLATKWAPGAGTYAATIRDVGTKFYDEACRKADPRPELVAMARGGKPGQGQPLQVAETMAEPQQPQAQPAQQQKVSGADLARRAIADGKADDAPRAGLGAQAIARAAGGPVVKLLNAPQGDAAPAFDEPQGPVQAQVQAQPHQQPQQQGQVQPQRPAPQAATAATKFAAAQLPAGPRITGDKPALQTAAAAAAKAAAVAPPPAAASRQTCRVWTASYGGQKAVIVRAVTDGVVNFTVLDVHEGDEARQAQAFIAAYAKGGAVAGEFANQNQALDKAFDLCPEG
jgi:hypothetical protein